MDVLRSFSSDQLGRFLHQAAGRGRAAWEVFVWGMEDVQHRGDQIPLSQFAQTLIDVRVEEWVKKRLAQILRARASSMSVKADLAEMVAELVKGASAAEAEDLARRVYVPVLTEEVYPHLDSRKAATEWLLAHFSAVKGHSSASHLYLCIIRDSKYLYLCGRVSEERLRDYRVRALRCLAELALIVPLEHVEEIKFELRGHLSNPDEAVREATIDALVPIQRRLREAQAEVPVERPRDGARQRVQPPAPRSGRPGRLRRAKRSFGSPHPLDFPLLFLYLSMTA